MQPSPFARGALGEFRVHLIQQLRGTRSHRMQGCLEPDSNLCRSRSEFSNPEAARDRPLVLLERLGEARILGQFAQRAGEQCERLQRLAQIVTHGSQCARFGFTRPLCRVMSRPSASFSRKLTDDVARGAQVQVR